MKISRRDFFNQSSGILFAATPFLNTKTALVDVFKSNLVEQKLPDEKNILVLIHLAGGNDWLNTIIPYNDPAYFKLRPNLAIHSNTLLKLNDELAFHPALSEIKTAYDKNAVAIILNCGAVEHDLSHYKAIKQWQYIDTNQNTPRTWQANYAEHISIDLKDMHFPAINVEPHLYKEEN